MKVQILLIAIVTLFASGCNKDKDTVDAAVPTNLNMVVTISSDGSGKVDVTATSDGANYYDFYFGETSPETPTHSADGTETHVYATSGTFTIKVEAHTTAAAFSTKSEDAVVSVRFAPDGYITPLTYDGMTLMWHDEFDGAALNTADWTYETGAGGWGNDELENYTLNNATLADGFLTITAKKENDTYTSSRIKTASKKDFEYGRIDIRAKLPKGQGLWPALWMLGDNFSTVGWPRCGEIDIMEMIGGSGREKTTYGTPHWFDEGTNQHASFGGSKTLSSGTFNDKFHVFTILWDDTKIKWLMDDTQYHELDITGANLSEFRASFYFIFNVAVGGQWPGNPDETTVFPQTMVVDYVRVFQ